MRPATGDDLLGMRVVERRAGERYREVGLPEIADDEPLPVEVLAEFATNGQAWAAEYAGQLAGYVLVREVDGVAHIEQVSVVPEQQGRGLGRALIEQVVDWARARYMPAVTLTTFDQVPWNRPLYEHLGFAVLKDAEVGPELRALMEEEAEHGLDPSTRVAMRRRLR